MSTKIKKDIATANEELKKILMTRLFQISSVYMFEKQNIYHFAKLAG